MACLALAGLGSVLIDCQPLIVALLARALFADSINPVGWVGLGLGFAGILCLGVPAELLGHWWLLRDLPAVIEVFQPGEVTMLLAALALALGTVLIRFACRYSDPIAATGWHMILGGLPLLLIAALIAISACLPGMQWIGFDGVCEPSGQGLAYGLFFWFANRRDLTSFSSLGFLLRSLPGHRRMASRRTPDVRAVGWGADGAALGGLCESAAEVVGAGRQGEDEGLKPEAGADQHPDRCSRKRSGRRCGTHPALSGSGPG